ncbi:hypothetical protein FBEOM_11956 [Fusarium beomiforme]|uniref:Zn(2)-C6 fungal-type domain-containing protein n=1 Tax=Fusarium beomiforme TaxID=44412 RepID=A0A9P5DTI1_9HYPO|nr:hypothetical protein FBEOM_11956 [Fusarium beomiforme]
MSLRKSSCMACVSAKRRCDRGVPSCNRCAQKCLPCKYPYQRSGILSPVVGLPLNDFTSPTTPFLGSSESALEQGTFPVADLIDPGFQPTDDSITWSWDILGPQAAIDLPPPEQFFTPGANILNDLSSSLINDINCNQNSGADLSQRTGDAQRHRRKAYSRLCQQDLLRLRSTPDIGQALQTHEIWPRGRDTATWQFCAKELLSFVNAFATTASNPFILQPVASPNSNEYTQLPLSLQRALGVCATAYTLTESSRDVLDQLLETEMEHLAGDFGSHSVSNYDPTISIFRHDLARLQAMVLYQIITLFSTRARQQLLAKKYEPLISSWSRELLLRIQVLGLQKKGTGSPCLLQTERRHNSAANTQETFGDIGSVIEFPEAKVPLLPHEKPLHESEINSAYRTVLISYLARSVHSALIYQTCPLLAELGSLPVSIHSNEPGSDIYIESRQAFRGETLLNQEAPELSKLSKTISYNELADRWSQQKDFWGFNEHDRFVVLLLAACKGVDIINGQA